MSLSRFDPNYVLNLYELGRQSAQQQGWDESEWHLAGLLAVATYTQAQSRLHLEAHKYERSIHSTDPPKKL